MGKVSVAVVGAGPAGLCALRQLLCHHAGKFEPVAFERNSQIGGAWFYTNNTSKIPLHSAIYDSMRTNLPKEIMPYEGFPFPDDLPSYVHHSDFLRYLKSFADHFKLNAYIKLNTEVMQIVPKHCSSSFLDGTSWEVTTRDLQTGDQFKREFDAVLVCNGHYTLPYYNIKGRSNFRGNLMHSQTYRNPHPFESQAVLIVGGSSSGTDIGLEVATVAKKVYLSCRRRGLAANPSVPKNLILSCGTTCILEDGSVLLDDGETLEVDSIIVCTGYEYDFPFLSEECGVTVNDHRVQPLYKHIFNIRHPSMAFIGLNLIILPLLNFEMQMKLISTVFTGSVQLPGKEAMLEDEEMGFQEKIKKGLRAGDAHKLDDQQWAYYKMLAEVGKFDEHEQIVENIYVHNSYMRRKDVMEYKNYKCEIIDREKCSFRFVPNCI